MKSQKFKYIVFPALILIIAFILTFQNCNQSDNGSVNKFSVSTTTSTTLSTGDKAVFKLSDKYGGDNVSDILWQVKSGSSCGESTKAVETGLSLEVPWNQDYGEEYNWDTSTIATLIHLEQEECFIYRKFNFGDAFSLDRLSCVEPMGYLSFSLSNDASINKGYFPAGSSVILEFNKSERVEESLEDKTFQWSIKKVGNDTELADQSHTSPQLTHTFSEMGLYDISIKEKNVSSGSSFSDERELFIGLCEEEVEAVEVVLSEESFGNPTPEGILEKRQPIFNYVRPADTDSNNKVTLIFNDSLYSRPIYNYKYKRSSSSKFIDIDIQNADECFLDTEPIQTCTLIGCPTEEPNCQINQCTYTIKDSLDSLPSCSANALDMSTLDTDKTQCTDDVFVVAASKEGQEYKKQRAFYKHCPADEDYCYFGSEENRLDDHNCPSS